MVFDGRIREEDLYLVGKFLAKKANRDPKLKY